MYSSFFSRALTIVANEFVLIVMENCFSMMCLQRISTCMFQKLIYSLLLVYIFYTCEWWMVNAYYEYTQNINLKMKHCSKTLLKNFLVLQTFFTNCEIKILKWASNRKNYVTNCEIVSPLLIAFFVDHFSQIFRSMILVFNQFFLIFLILGLASKIINKNFEKRVAGQLNWWLSTRPTAP